MFSVHRHQPLRTTTRTDHEWDVINDAAALLTTIAVVIAAAWLGMTV